MRALPAARSVIDTTVETIARPAMRPHPRAPTPIGRSSLTIAAATKAIAHPVHTEAESDTASARRTAASEISMYAA